MEILDVDIGMDDPVDMITIPIPDTVRTNGEQTPPRTYFGSCGRANIRVRLSLTSECPANRYGAGCATECVEEDGRRTCNYLGEPTCLGNYQPRNCDTCITGFQEPGCITCAPNYYPQGVCTNLCIPRDNSLGHFSCSIDGPVCLPGYTDTSTNCVTCTGNRKEPDCTECDDNFVGTNCDTCAPNYYPQGVCTILCIPRDDPLGHYTCDNDGNIVCLPGYTDTNTNCVTCSGNRKEPDCTECDENFVGANCDTCAPNYYPQGVCTILCIPRDNSLGHFSCSIDGPVCLPGYTDTSTNCVTCIGNRKEPDCTECDDNFVGTNCDTCAPNYHPPGQCFCTPRNDSGGHYTCDPVTGDRICLEGYMDPETFCVQRSGKSMHSL